MFGLIAEVNCCGALFSYLIGLCMYLCNRPYFHGYFRYPNLQCLQPVQNQSTSSAPFDPLHDCSEFITLYAHESSAKHGDITLMLIQTAKGGANN